MLWLTFYSASAYADVVILPPPGGLALDVKASSAPNVFGDPAWTGYQPNALASLEGGLGNIGDRDIDPTAYEVLTGTYEAGDVMVTSFPSWRGVAFPPAPFSGGRGNRLHGGLHIAGDGITMFTLHGLNFAFLSTDSALNFVGDFVGLDFNCTSRYGIHWGADRAKGGGDDTTICGAGSGALLVDEMVYVGVGNAYWPGGGPVPSGTEQDEIDSVIAYLEAVQPTISIEYWITGTDDVEYRDGVTLAYAPVPEPASAAIFALGLAGLGAMRRRRS